MNLALHMSAAARRGAGLLEDEARARLRAYVRNRRAPGGGFRGRTEAADIYYTVFGLGMEDALGLPGDPPADRGFLASAPVESLDFVHRSALIRALALAGDLAAAAARLGGLEADRDDETGGYRPRDPGGTGSAYAGFLALLAYDSVGRTPPHAAGLAEAEAEEAQRPPPGAGAPVHAAVCAVLARLGRAPSTKAAHALAACAAPGGGFRAAPAAPAPDLLSTAVGLFALRLAGLDQPDPAGQARFVESCWRSDGGFGGHPADGASDVEYGAYALLALGSLV